MSWLLSFVQHLNRSTAQGLNYILRGRQGEPVTWDTLPPPTLCTYLTQIPHVTPAFWHKEHCLISSPAPSSSSGCLCETAAQVVGEGSQYTHGGSPDFSPHCSDPALLSVCKRHSHNYLLLAHKQACKKARQGSSQSWEGQFSSRNKPAEVQGEKTGNEEGLMFHAEFRGLYLLGTKSGFIYAVSWPIPPPKLSHSTGRPCIVLMTCLWLWNVGSMYSAVLCVVAIWYYGGRTCPISLACFFLQEAIVLQHVGGLDGTGGVIQKGVKYEFLALTQILC